MKISVLGNCQGQIFQSLFAADRPRFTVLPAPLVYQQSEADYGEAFRAQMEESDIVISRHFGNELKFKPAVTENLRKLLGKKLVVFPNIYFNGNMPDFYVPYTFSGHVFKGPSGDYHSRIIRQSFAQGLSVDETYRKMQAPDTFEVYADSYAKSLKFIEDREAEADIKVADIITSHPARDMYSYNHPSNSILYGVYERLMEQIGQQPLDTSGDPLRPYRLDDVVLPIFPQIGVRNGVADADCSFVWLVRGPDRRHREIELREYIEGCFESYAEEDAALKAGK